MDQPGVRGTLRLFEAVELGYLFGLLDHGELNQDIFGEELVPLVGNAVPAAGERLADNDIFS